MISNTNEYDWQKIILGIRAKLNLSQSNLSKKLDLARCTVIRWENRKKFPRKYTIRRISNFIDENKLDINELKLIGQSYIKGYSKDMKIRKLNLNPSKELAELIGIILGDGEIMKDGTIRISFDPKKDKNFLYRKVFPLVHNLIGNKIGYESNKRISFGNIAFVRYLKEYCNLNPGSKFRNNWEIPKWCFEKEEYASAVLRGLFDTDGYFGYWGGSLEVMFGRFSDKCTKLVKSLELSLKLLNFNPIVKHTKDGRYRIRIQNKRETIKFFSNIGTSNIKHVVRFLLWRIAGYEAKIEKEGLKKLIYLTNKVIETKIERTELPYFWSNQHSIKWKHFIEEDPNFIKMHIKKTKSI